MKNILGIVIGLSLIAPFTASAACSPVALGGTGSCSITSQLILFGNGTSPIATSSVFSYNSALTKLSFPYASSTAQNISGSLWLTALGTPAGTLIAVDPNGKVIATSTPSAGTGTVTNIATTYPVTGGPITTTGTIALAFGTTTANSWSALNIFANATTTLLTVGTNWWVPQTSAVLVAGSGGLVGSGTTQTCTNQFFRALSAAYAATCATVVLTADVTGILPIANGGTNASSYTQSGGILAFDGTRAVNFSGYTLTSTLLTATNASTTNLSAATSLFIPNSSSQTPTVAGQLAQDTTDNQLKLGTGGSTVVIDQRRVLSFSYATTTAWTGTTTLALGTAPFGFTFTNAQCYTDVGTLNVLFKYGTGPTLVVPEVFGASTTVGTVAFTSNNTPVSPNTLKVDVGTPATAPTTISCSVTATVTGS